MSLQPESNRGEVVYRIDSFSIIFRELDLLHSEIREIKSEISFLHKRIDETNNRIDEMNIRIDETNKRIDELARDINRRLDKLFLVVIINLVAILGFLLKIILDGLIK
jgi:septal ring factor EnvC (AmiA/AmiB activator)